MSSVLRPFLMITSLHIIVCMSSNHHQVAFFNESTDENVKTYTGWDVYMRERGGGRRGRFTLRNVISAVIHT
jgi:hypothetical protein